MAKYEDEKKSEAEMKKSYQATLIPEEQGEEPESRRIEERRTFDPTLIPEENPEKRNQKEPYPTLFRKSLRTKGQNLKGRELHPSLSMMR